MVVTGLCVAAAVVGCIRVRRELNRPPFRGSAPVAIHQMDGNMLLPTGIVVAEQRVRPHLIVIAIRLIGRCRYIDLRLAMILFGVLARHRPLIIVPQLLLLARPEYVQEDTP